MQHSVGAQLLATVIGFCNGSSVNIRMLKDTDKHGTERLQSYVYISRFNLRADDPRQSFWKWS